MWLFVSFISLIHSHVHTKLPMVLRYALRLSEPHADPLTRLRLATEPSNQLILLDCAHFRAQIKTYQLISMFIFYDVLPYTCLFFWTPAVIPSHTKLPCRDGSTSSEPLWPFAPGCWSFSRVTLLRRTPFHTLKQHISGNTHIHIISVHVHI